MDIDGQNCLQSMVKRNLIVKANCFERKLLTGDLALATILANSVKAENIRIQEACYLKPDTLRDLNFYSNFQVLGDFQNLKGEIIRNSRLKNEMIERWVRAGANIDVILNEIAKENLSLGQNAASYIYQEAFQHTKKGNPLRMETVFH